MVQKENISMNRGGKLQVHVNTVIIESGALHVAMIPSLFLTARSGVSQTDAMSQIKETLRHYLTSHIKKGNLDNELMRIGWFCENCDDSEQGDSRGISKPIRMEIDATLR